MDCKTIFIRRRRRGFTLAEFLVAIGLGGILILAVASLSLYSGRSLAAMLNYVDLDNNSRSALDILSRDIRQCNRLKSFVGSSTAATSITLEDYDGTDLTFTWDSAARTLTRIKSGATKTLLTECDTLAFALYQRNPVNGTYDQYPTASATTCKLISVTWTCSRTIFNSKVNTESVQTAKIVIRKQ